MAGYFCYNTANFCKEALPVMTDRKFFVLFMFGMMLFFSAVTGGCGGGGSNSFADVDNPPPPS